MFKPVEFQSSFLNSANFRATEKANQSLWWKHERYHRRMLANCYEQTAAQLKDQKHLQHEFFKKRASEKPADTWQAHFEHLGAWTRNLSSRDTCPSLFSLYWAWQQRYARL
ncbi:MAG: hypothetical protein IPJ88_13280 [Myxococcales bacterium]|nr:MAG: hypothetical protein IPJ88_13280 [Myxococcales bacterium]